jgi:hypothetical protein
MDDETLRNHGHGHVWERQDGIKARCGGPGMCKDCDRDERYLREAAEYNSPIAVVFLLSELDRVRSRLNMAMDALDNVVMAAELPGDHCEMSSAVAFAKRVLTSANPTTQRCADKA